MIVTHHPSSSISCPVRTTPINSLRRMTTTISSTNRLRSRLAREAAAAYPSLGRSPIRDRRNSLSRCLRSTPAPINNHNHNPSNNNPSNNDELIITNNTSVLPSVLLRPHLIVAALLNRIATANDILIDRATSMAMKDITAARLITAANKFTGRSIPSISLKSYAERLARYSPMSESVWVATLVAIDRIANSHHHDHHISSSINTITTTTTTLPRIPPVVVTSNNVHRILLLAFMIASKLNSDAYYANKYFAKVGGIPLSELNKFEFEFLFLSHFNLSVSTAEYTRYTDRLTAYAMAMTSTPITMSIPSTLVTPPSPLSSVVSGSPHPPPKSSPITTTTNTTTTTVSVPLVSDHSSTSCPLLLHHSHIDSNNPFVSRYHNKVPNNTVMLFTPPVSPPRELDVPVPILPTTLL